MNGQISKILKEKNLSASKFADEIGVQRSSISHIISGRNKPSLDFIRKVILKYPEINAEWLITGKGQMMLENYSDRGNKEQKGLFGLIDEKKEKEDVQTSPPRQQGAEKRDKNLRQPIKAPTGEKRLIKLILLYDDGSFSDYYPENQ